MQTSSGRRTRMRLYAFLLALSSVVTLIVAIQQRHRAALNVRERPEHEFSDFDRFLIMTPRFVHDHADYVDDQLPTPPVSFLILGPLSEFGRVDAQFVWALLKLPMICLAFALALGLVRRAGGDLTKTAIGLIVAGWWLPVIVDMQEGQTNFLAMLPLLAGLYVAQRETTGSALGAGGLISLGVAMKVTPIVFAAYFLWRRRYLLVASILAGTAFWSLVVPGLAFGWAQNLRWLDQWAHIMILPYAAQGKVLYATSQSIGSFVLRLLTAMPAFESHHGGITEPHYMNVLTLSDASARWVVRGLMAGIGLAGLWWMRRPLATLREPRYVVEVGAVAAFMLWFSERTWAPHYVSFLVTLSAAAMVASDAGRSAHARQAAAWSLAAFAAVTLLASDVGRVFGPDSLNWIRAAGVFLWPSVAVTAVMIRAASARNTEREVRDGVSAV
jgi:hypothetical protein